MTRRFGTPTSLRLEKGTRTVLDTLAVVDRVPEARYASIHRRWVERPYRRKAIGEKPNPPPSNRRPTGSIASKSKSPCPPTAIPMRSKPDSPPETAPC